MLKRLLMVSAGVSLSVAVFSGCQAQDDQKQVGDDSATLKSCGVSLTGYNPIPYEMSWDQAKFADFTIPGDYLQMQDAQYYVQLTDTDGSVQRVHMRATATKDTTGKRTLLLESVCGDGNPQGKAFATDDLGVLDYLVTSKVNTTPGHFRVTFAPGSKVLMATAPEDSLKDASADAILAGWGSEYRLYKVNDVAYELRAHRTVQNSGDSRKEEHYLSVRYSYIH